MYLVDTSVWIGYPKERESEAVALFVDVLDLPFGITGVIYGEVLQGARTTADLEKLKEYMSTQRFYHLQDPIVGYEEAARLYHRCGRRGITVRSTIDCLISRVAIEHDLALLHDDGDFASIGRVVDELKLEGVMNSRDRVGSMSACRRGSRTRATFPTRSGPSWPLTWRWSARMRPSASTTSEGSSTPCGGS